MLCMHFLVLPALSQLSAAHTLEQVDHCVDSFIKVKKALGA